MASSILNSSMMTNLGNLVQLGQDAVKAAKNAVKGLGQDSKYFASTKKGAWWPPRESVRAPSSSSCAIIVTIHLFMTRPAPPPPSPPARAGEVSELRNELASPDVDVMKDAVKKVIAAITVGKDMNALFPDVVNCMRTENVEVKKLVYLYLINYAKSNPDLTIMAVNSFVKDSEHPSPLIRALAIRTMGCIRVEKIVEYLTPPLKKALGDEDPYVRKTAALGVAKLYDISPATVKQQGCVRARARWEAPGRGGGAVGGGWMGRGKCGRPLLMRAS